MKLDFSKLNASQVIHNVQSLDNIEQCHSIQDQSNLEPVYYNPITKIEHIMNNFETIDEFVRPEFFSGSDSFFMCCLYIIDNTIAISKLVDAKVMLKSFRRDLAYHLDSEKAIFKKVEFTKRKKLTVQHIRDELNKEHISDIIYTYLSRLLKFDFIIIKNNSLPTIINKKTHKQSYIFKLENNTYSVSITPKDNSDISFIKNRKIKA